MATDVLEGEEKVAVSETEGGRWVSLGKLRA